MRETALHRFSIESSPTSEGRGRMLCVGQVVGKLVEWFEIIAQQHGVSIGKDVADDLHLLVRLEVIYDGCGTLKRVHIVLGGVRVHIHRLGRIDVLIGSFCFRWRIVLLLAYQLDTESAVAVVSRCSNARMRNLRHLRIAPQPPKGEG